MHITELHLLLEELTSLPKECEWVEFKVNNKDPQMIGERISALSNSANLDKQKAGYLVWGIEDNTHNIIGTTFSFKKEKKGNEELEFWILKMLSPKIDFKIYEFNAKRGERIVLVEISPAKDIPVKFINISYIRVGSVTRKLLEFPEKEKKIWKSNTYHCFEDEYSLEGIEFDKIFKLLDIDKYYELLDKKKPEKEDAIVHHLLNEKLITENNGLFKITNMFALCFAKSLKDFPNLSRKTIRVILYDGKDRIDTKQDQVGVRGYAVGFQGLIKFINEKLPSNEVIKNALRKVVEVYPQIAVRELVANAMVHQDFSEKGTAPLIEIFDDRIEFSNPGLPIIQLNRFIDEYQSRNEKFATFLRGLRICEEKGSGIDKVIKFCEIYQLPAPKFEVSEKKTKITLYAPLKFVQMDRGDKIRACYQHCCLKYISNDKMTNQSLRDRFNIKKTNHSMASRIIRDTIDEGYIKEEDLNNKSKKYASYVPYWVSSNVIDK